jgi:SAM-dependent methyltransferase
LHAPAFDVLAADYDAAFTETPLGAALRGLVWSRLDVLFRGAEQILDLGCGTGEDALRLAARGTRVVAIDASPGMVRRAQEKARAQGCVQQIQFHCLPMQELGTALTGASFDGALSNFGALNCVEDLPALVAAVAARLAPGARLLWVPMGRYVPWEWAWYLLRAQPRKAWRRLRRERLAWRGVTLGYPTPRQLMAVLQPYFHIDSVRPLGFALPPSYAAGWLNRRPRLLAALSRLERAGQRYAFLAACSDHYIVEATRLPTPTGAPSAAASAER